MLTTEPTAEMIAEWKRIFEKYHSSLTPDRKTGEEVDKYFRGKYPCTASDNEEFREAVYFNITENEYSKSKLKNGTLPDIRCYKTGNVLVGIDLNSGEFHMESENIEDIIPELDKMKRDGDIILTLGAGNISRIGNEYSKKLSSS